MSLSALGEQLASAIETDPPEVVRQIEQLEQAVNNGTFSAGSSDVARSIVGAALNGE